MDKLVDPTTHPDWLQPHSAEWYQQVGIQQGKYEYSWNSVVEGPTGESLFDQEILKMVKDKKALDVGCGHGDIAITCSPVAKEIIGFDFTNQFIGNGNARKTKNLSFVLGNIKEGLPFERDEFDCAYIRKGPTSSYPLLHNVVKSGGEVLGLHPGDESGKELLYLFPNMFRQPKGKVMDVLLERLEISSFLEVDIEIVNSTEFLQSPMDVIKLCCFGQQDSVLQMMVDKNMASIVNIFERNASHKGLAITQSHYMVRAVI